MSYSSQEQQLPEFMKVIVYSYKNTNSTMTTGVNVAEEQRPCRSKVLQSTKSDHVWVRVHAVGLNPVDAKNFMGDKLPQSWNTLRSWVKRRIVNRTIPGFDFAGTVVAVASSTSTVTSFQPGDAVYGTMPPLKGTLAEYICAPSALFTITRAFAIIRSVNFFCFLRHHTLSTLADLSNMQLLKRIRNRLTAKVFVQEIYLSWAPWGVCEVLFPFTCHATSLTIARSFHIDSFWMKAEIRRAIYNNESEWVFKPAMATEIMDTYLKSLHNNKWDMVFKEVKDDIYVKTNRKATINIEHLIRQQIWPIRVNIGTFFRK